jgi:hypothetical protein
MAPPDIHYEEIAVIICSECGGKCGIPGAIKNAILKSAFAPGRRPEKNRLQAALCAIQDVNS